MQTRLAGRRTHRGSAGHLILVGAVFSLLGAPQTVTAQDGAQPANAMRLYRDPETGKIGSPPPGAVLEEAAPPAQREAAKTGEPTSEAVTAPAGGVKVKLNGRFQAAVQRHAGSVPTHECIEGGAAAHE